jgi:hypothetical protein
MKIPMISDWLYQLHSNRVYWLTRAERRRALRLFCVLTALITISVVLWIVYK